MCLTPTALRIEFLPMAEHCAVCSRTLEEGIGKEGLVYVLRDCRCVSLLTPTSTDFSNIKKVICGFCVRFPGVPPFLPCQRADHLDCGWQRPLRLYNLTCAICLDSESSPRIALVCGKLMSSIQVYELTAKATYIVKTAFLYG